MYASKPGEAGGHVHSILSAHRTGRERALAKLGLFKVSLKKYVCCEVTVRGHPQLHQTNMHPQQPLNPCGLEARLQDRRLASKTPSAQAV